MYVGSNWQRWEQVRRFLEGYAVARERVGPAILAGWDWSARPEWAVRMGIMGIDADPALLARLGVEVRDGVRFDEVVGLLGQAKFAPVIHRPLFRHLGHRHEPHIRDLLRGQPARSCFCRAISWPRSTVKRHSRWCPGEDIAAHLDDALSRPEAYWEAVLQTRSHLARHHSYARRLEELAAFTNDRTGSGGTR